MQAAGREFSSRRLASSACHRSFENLASGPRCSGQGCYEAQQNVRELDGVCNNITRGYVGALALTNLGVSLEEQPGLQEPSVQIDSKIDPSRISTKRSVYQRGIVPQSQVSPKSQLRVTIEGVERYQFPARVSAHVYVRDELGNLVANLAPPYATEEQSKDWWEKVVESREGKPCGGRDLKVREFRENTTPKRTVAFVADYSGSMVGTIESVEQDLAVSVRELRATGALADRWGLIKFDHNVKVELPLLQQGFSKLDAQLRGLEGFGGATALRDAVLEGIAQLTTAPPSSTRILVVFTDGQENASLAMDWRHVLEEAQKQKVHIHAIGYGQVDEAVLSMLADRTGGSSYLLRTSDEIVGIFRGIIQKTEAYYEVSYKPCPGAERRRLTIKLSHNDNSIESRYEYEQTTPVFPEDTGTKVLVLFDFDRSKREFAAYDPIRIRQVTRFLLANPSIRMRLTGYTDSKGDIGYNEKLSHDRAQTVAKMLFEQGIPPGQVYVVASGKNKLIHNPDWPDEWKARENRRVEFQLTP